MTSGPRSGSGRKLTNGGQRPMEVPSDQDHAALDARLRDLHDSLADDEEVPDHLVSLARRISDAYERMNGRQNSEATEDEESGQSGPSGDQGGWN